ncbi:MAG: hypothetical protein EA362_05280 [Saprospirales bacterium]|nr:MAG: hypothetical protein EA362_05280 [Saprospirales bacterium]
MNIKNQFLLIVLLTFFIQLSSCRWDSTEHHLTSHIFELNGNSVDSTQQVFFHFLENGNAIVFNFRDFTKIETQTGNWKLKNDSLKIALDNEFQAMVFRRDKQSPDRNWTAKDSNSLFPLDLDKIESTIFIPAEKYGINEPVIPFLFLESTQNEKLLLRLFSSCDYLSAQFEINADQPLNIQLPPRRFESNCSHLERSEEIKNQINESDQLKYEFPDLFFMKKGEIIGHWRAVGGLAFDL